MQPLNLINTSLKSTYDLSPGLMHNRFLHGFAKQNAMSRTYQKKVYNCFVPGKREAV
jgi:hypothetical protein